jgi:hypothetical protein
MKDTQLDWQRKIIREEYKDLKLNEHRENITVSATPTMQRRLRTGISRVEKKMGK